jgi:Kef-type K+ transport system membrane component KefB
VGPKCDPPYPHAVALEVVRDLAVMFVAAKAAGLIFRALRQPALIGELLAGVVLGPHALGAFGLGPVQDIVAEAGAVVLLFMVGLDTPLSHLRAVGTTAASVGVAGIILPFALGLIVAWLYGLVLDQSLFLATALVATSVGVTARVLYELGRTRERASRVIIGAAVVDDILGLLILGVVTGASGGDISILELIFVAGAAVGFVALVGTFGTKAVRTARPVLDRLNDRGVLVVALLVCLALSGLAHVLRLAAIMGAFLAGMAFAETKDHYRLEHNLQPLYWLLVPFFFVVTGAIVDPAVLTASGTVVFTGIVVIVAVFGKFVGSGFAARSLGRKDAAIVGVGMVPRGEVGILVASIGSAEGIVDAKLYAAVVSMSVITTLITPPILKQMFGDVAQPRTEGPRTDDIEGVDG